MMIGCMSFPQFMRSSAGFSMFSPLANLWYSMNFVRYGEAPNRAGDSVALSVVRLGSGIYLSPMRWRVVHIHFAVFARIDPPQITSFHHRLHVSTSFIIVDFCHHELVFRC